MDEALAETVRINADATENVIDLLNSMTSDSLQFFLDSFTTSLSVGDAVDVNKNSSAVIGDVGEAVSSDSPQPFSGVLPTTHDAHIA